MERKPLREWTLSGCADHCRNHMKSDEDCDSCILMSQFSYGCIFSDLPIDIDFDEMQERRNNTFSEKELDILKAIGAKWVSRDIDSYFIDIWCEEPAKIAYENGLACYAGDRVGCLQCELFPNVLKGSIIKVNY